MSQKIRVISDEERQRRYEKYQEYKRNHNIARRHRRKVRKASDNIVVIRDEGEVEGFVAHTWTLMKGRAARQPVRVQSVIQRGMEMRRWSAANPTYARHEWLEIESRDILEWARFWERKLGDRMLELHDRRVVQRKGINLRARGMKRAEAPIDWTEPLNFSELIIATYGKDGIEYKRLEKLQTCFRIKHDGDTEAGSGGHVEGSAEVPTVEGSAAGPVEESGVD